MNRMAATAPVMAALLGAVIGFTSAQRAHATTTYTSEIMGGATNYMTCGWHGECDSTPTAGGALDWAPNTNHAIYFRSWAYRASGSQATIARDDRRTDRPDMQDRVGPH